MPFLLLTNASMSFRSCSRMCSYVVSKVFPLCSFALRKAFASSAKETATDWARLNEVVVCMGRDSWHNMQYSKSRSRLYRVGERQLYNATTETRVTLRKKPFLLINSHTLVALRSNQVGGKSLENWFKAPEGHKTVETKVNLSWFLEAILNNACKCRIRYTY